MQFISLTITNAVYLFVSIIDFREQESQIRKMIPTASGLFYLS